MEEDNLILPDYLEYSNNLIKVDTTSMLHYYMMMRIEYGTNSIKKGDGKYIAGPFMTHILINSLSRIDDRYKEFKMPLEKCDIFAHDDNLSVENKSSFDREYRYIKTNKADTMEHLFESFNEPQYQIGFDIKSKEFYMTRSAYEFYL